MKKIILAGIFFVLLSAANFADAATIEKHLYHNVPGLIYPVVKVDNPDAEAKINQKIYEEIQRTLQNLKNRAGEDYMSIHLSYSVPCNQDGGLLSIIFSESVMIEKAAHPWNMIQTLNFNSDSGEQITTNDLSEIARHGNDYTPAELTRKLRIFAEKTNRKLNQDFTGLSEIPKNFYFDENLHVHFLFEQETIAHYAYGHFDLDADATY